MESDFVPLGESEEQVQTAGVVPEAPPPSPLRQRRETEYYDANSPPSSPIIRRATDERAAPASNSAIRQKYLKLKEIFVINNDMGFPETAADFVIANLESLDKEWTSLINKGILFVRDRVRIISGPETEWRLKCIFFFIERNHYGSKRREHGASPKAVAGC